MTDRIRGKVAEILNSRELVINRGSVHGVEAGMKFAVLNSRGLDIRDPETGEQLEGVDLEKTIVKIVRVSERVSVGRTFRTYSTAGVRNFSALFQPSVTRVETFRTDQHTAREELAEEESYVKRGDPVVEYRDDEFLEEEVKTT